MGGSRFAALARRQDTLSANAGECPAWPSSTTSRTPPVYAKEAVTFGWQRHVPARATATTCACCDRPAGQPAGLHGLIQDRTPNSVRVVKPMGEATELRMCARSTSSKCPRTRQLCPLDPAAILPSPFECRSARLEHYRVTTQTRHAGTADRRGAQFLHTDQPNARVRCSRVNAPIGQSLEYKARLKRRHAKRRSPTGMGSGSCRGLRLLRLKRAAAWELPPLVYGYLYDAALTGQSRPANRCRRRHHARVAAGLPAGPGWLAFDPTKNMTGRGQ